MLKENHIERIIMNMMIARDTNQSPPQNPTMMIIIQKITENIKKEGPHHQATEIIGKNTTRTEMRRLINIMRRELRSNQIEIQAKKHKQILKNPRRT
jgi:hypothetical protein